MITDLRGCRLTVREVDEDGRDNGIVDGFWRQATCEEFSAALDAFGYNTKDFHAHLRVYSALTDTYGLYGSPTIFTEWGTADGHRPVAAHANDMKLTRASGTACTDEHAIYITEALER